MQQHTFLFLENSKISKFADSAILNFVLMNFV